MAKAKFERNKPHLNVGDGGTCRSRQNNFDGGANGHIGERIWRRSEGL